MRKLLPDTNIYGRIVADPERKTFHEQVHNSLSLLFGFEIIRKELRDTPKSASFTGKNLRVDLLQVYDDLVQKTYPVEERIINLAEAYFLAYRELGGSISKEKILPDFLIVACATIKQMDIVVSEDRHSMLTENAVRAYQLVNKLKDQRLPEFISYLQLKERICLAI